MEKISDRFCEHEEAALAWVLVAAHGNGGLEKTTLDAWFRGYREEA